MQTAVSGVKESLDKHQRFIMKIKSNTTNNDLPWQELEEELVSFSSDEGL